MIPALFVRCKIEEEIRHEQGATRNMQEEMLFETWDACDSEDFKLARPIGTRGKERLDGEIHDLVEALRGKERNTGKIIASLPRVSVMEHHRFDQPGRLAQGFELGQVT
jgi:hypothetical protein